MDFLSEQPKPDNVALAGAEAQPVGQNDAAPQTEQTVGGKLISFVHDTLAGKSESTQEQSERAARNDMYAEIAADTVAMVPGMGYLRAGAARAGMLANPEAGVGDNAGHAALNFAEGAALQGLSKYGTKVFARGPGSSMLSDSAGLFKIGAGMGAVKSCFDQQNWVDGEGNLNLAGGFTGMGKGALIGGAFGVPAGLAGMHIARFGASRVGGLDINPRAMSVGLGAVSGYPAGAVFGGLEAATHGAGVGDTLKAANEGGLIGVAAGGATGGLIKSGAFENSRSLLSERQVTDSSSDATVAAPMSRSSQQQEVLTPPKLEANTRRNPIENEAEFFNLFRRSEYRTNVGLKERLAMLGEPRAGKTIVETAVPEAYELAGKASSQNEYARNAIKKHVEDARIYRVEGVDIALPESLAKDLDYVFNLRMMKERGFSPEATATQRAEATRAADELASHPMANWAHPADIAPLVRQLPDRTIIEQRINMYGNDSANDAWLRHEYKDTFETAAQATKGGEIDFFKAMSDGHLPRTMRHEYGHLLDYKTERDAHAYLAAAELEMRSHSDRQKEGHVISEYAKRNAGEDVAERLADFLAPDPSEFFVMAKEAPLRTSILSDKVKVSLDAVPEDKRSPYHEQFAERVNYVDEHIKPEAQRLLGQYLTSASVDERTSAAVVLTKLGTERQIEYVKNMAIHEKNDALREAAFKSYMNRALYGDKQVYDQLTDTAGRNRKIDFLLEAAQPGSLSRTEALHALKALKTPRAQGHYALLTAGRVSENTAVKRLSDAVKQIPELAGKEQAYEDGWSLLRGNKDEQWNFATTVMKHAPELQAKVLADLTALDPLRAEPALRKLAQKPDHPLHELAVEKLRGARH